MKREVWTDRMIERILGAGKTAAVPRISGKELEFFTLSSSRDRFVLNRYGIREPGPEHTHLDLSRWKPARVLLVVPGLAFDAEKNRLGRGGGFYDRFIHYLRGRAETSLTTIGVFFHCQKLQVVPLDPWDETLDTVVTDKILIR